MKELSIEEKARRYDEAIEKARQLCAYPTTKPFISDLQDIFPELSELEDENIIEEIERLVESAPLIMGLDKDKIFAWLEKQAEQKPTDKVEPKQEWSDEDENLLKEFMKDIRLDMLSSYAEKYCNWLKNLKDRVQPQPRQEWSEEDELSLKQAIYVCHQNGYTAVENWLKSLRPQSQWKPSDEQMMAIDTAINVLGKGTLNGKQLIELYQDLKKLTGE